MLELTLRLVFSLAAVLGLLVLLARLGSRRFRGGRDSMIQVLHRQHLSRSSAVSVVAVGTRVLVLGTTEQQVRVLAELEPDEIGGTVDLAGADVLALVPAEPDVTQPALPAPERTERTAGAHRAGTVAGPRRSGRSTGPLAGSVLSADTWRQALTAATRRAS